MKIDIETPLRVVIRAHDSPRCTHTVTVVGLKPIGPTYGPPAHVMLLWGDSQGPLGTGTSREFAFALTTACDIADIMERNGGYDG